MNFIYSLAYSITRIGYLRVIRRKTIWAMIYTYWLNSRLLAARQLYLLNIIVKKIDKNNSN